MQWAQIGITQARTAAASPLPGGSSRASLLASEMLKACWRSVVCRGGRRCKRLAVVESVALGDRRFVSVVRFERQLFLIGSSPASVTLLSQLRDEARSGERGTEESGEKNQ
jgi:flagellar biogenesis protein FliO